MDNKKQIIFFIFLVILFIFSSKILKDMFGVAEKGKLLRNRLNKIMLNCENKKNLKGELNKGRNRKELIIKKIESLANKYSLKLISKNQGKNSINFISNGDCQIIYNFLIRFTKIRSYFLIKSFGVKKQVNICFLDLHCLIYPDT